MVKCIYSSAWAHNLTNHCLAFMEVIRHAELIVEWSLWTIEHTNRSLDNSMQRFAHHGLRQAYNYTTNCNALYAWWSPWWVKRCIELSSNLLVSKETSLLSCFVCTLQHLYTLCTCHFIIACVNSWLYTYVILTLYVYVSPHCCVEYHAHSQIFVAWVLT